MMLLQSGRKSPEKEDSGKNGVIIFYHRTRVNYTEKWRVLAIFNCKKKHDLIEKMRRKRLRSFRDMIIFGCNFENDKILFLFC